MTQKTTVYFVELPQDNKVRLVCEITEKFYLQTIRVGIYAAEDRHCSMLDRQLWTWKPDSFLPHRVVKGKEEEIVEPILISTQLMDLENCQALIAFDPLPTLQIPSSIRWVIDFAEKYDQGKLIASRARYKRFRDAGGFQLEFAPSGAFLRKSFELHGAK